MYVAATRARDLLVISRWTKSGGGTVRPWKDFDPYIDHAEPLPVPAGVGVAAEQPTDLGPDARAAAEVMRNERREIVLQASWQVESVTAISHRGAVGRGAPGGLTREPDTGMAWGTLVHALLESAVRSPHRDRTHLERLANWLTLGNPELRRVVPEALDTVERVTASEFWQRAMTAEERQVEVPFAVKISIEGSPPRILHGIVDLALRFPTGWELIDYKTDQLGTDVLIKGYGSQVREYAKHWASLTGATVSYAGLYGIWSNELTENLI